MRYEFTQDMIDSLEDTINNLPKGDPSQDRLRIVYSVAIGHDIDEIARIFFVSKDTVRRYVRDFINEGKSSYGDWGGSKPKLNEKQTAELLEHLSENTYTKTKDIVDYVSSNYNVNFSTSGMAKWLKKHDMVYKKPIKVPAKADH